MKGLLISGTKSGIGKTTITMALMSAMKNVAPFKVGPDFIDPKFQEYATGNKSYNLDGFMLGENIVKELFWEKSQYRDISVIEGVMGLYDGLGHEKENFSSAHISRILDVPVILVVDGKGISTSIGAEVLGYKLLDERVNIKGVIINNVNSEKLYLHLKEAVEKYSGIECVGYFPKVEGVTLESRHLGLIQADEINDLDEKLEILKIQAEKTLDLEKIYNIANQIKKPQTNERFGILESVKDKLKGRRIGIAWDRAFSFYYNDNLELLEHTGAEIVKFSPIRDKKLPENLDFIYFGGGYPENFAEQLSGNTEMIKDIKEVFEKNIPIYAECGGFIYLTKGIKKLDEKFYDFAGLLDIKVQMKKNLNIKRFGYIDIETVEGLKIKGHEFHYSDIYDINEKETIFNIKKQNGNAWQCGYRKKNLIAGYPHINFFGNGEFFVWIVGIGS